MENARGFLERIALQMEDSDHDKVLAGHVRQLSYAVNADVILDTVQMAFLLRVFPELDYVSNPFLAIIQVAIYINGCHARD